MLGLLDPGLGCVFSPVPPGQRLGRNFFPGVLADFGKVQLVHLGDWVLFNKEKVGGWVWAGKSAQVVARCIQSVQ